MIDPAHNKLFGQSVGAFKADITQKKNNCTVIEINLIVHLFMQSNSMSYIFLTRLTPF